MGVVETTVIKGTIYWPFLNKKNAMKDKYTVDVGQLSDKDIKKLKAIGVGKHIKVDQPKDGYVEEGDKFVPEDKDDKDLKVRSNRGTFISLKSNFVPKVEDRTKNKLDPAAVGEGSEAQVRVQAYDWTFGNKKGDAAKGTLGAGFTKIVVNELVSFTGGGDDDSDFDYEEPDDDDDDDNTEDEDDEFDQYEDADDDK